MIYYQVFKNNIDVGIGQSEEVEIPSGNNHFSYKKIAEKKYNELNKNYVISKDKTESNK